MTHLVHTGFELGPGKCFAATGQGQDAVTRYAYGRSYRTNSNEYVAFEINHDTVIVGAAIFQAGSLGDIFRFYGDAWATQHLSIYQVVPSTGASGSVVAYRNFSGGPILGTSTIQVSSNAWHYWEVKAVLHDTTGSVEVRVDGQVVLNLSGVDTKNAGTLSVFNGVRIGSNVNHTTYVDDVYVNNGAGAAPDNDFWGEIAIKTLVPTGDGNSSQLVGSDGNSVSNWQQVDEAFNALPNTTDYNGSATPGQKDTYALTDLTGTVSAIRAVSFGAYAAKSDAGAISGRRVIRSGGTDHTGADLVLGATYTWFFENFPTNPATGLAWTQADVDALQAGWEARA